MQLIAIGNRFFKPGLGTSRLRKCDRATTRAKKLRQLCLEYRSYGNYFILCELVVDVPVPQTSELFTEFTMSSSQDRSPQASGEKDHGVSVLLVQTTLAVPVPSLAKEGVGVLRAESSRQAPPANRWTVPKPLFPANPRSNHPSSSPAAGGRNCPGAETRVS